MPLKSFLLCTFFFCFAFRANAQNLPVTKDRPVCASDIFKNEMSRESRQRLDKINHEIYLRSISGKFNRTAVLPAGQFYTLPVVVHIIHNGGPENITDAQVLDVIQDLNYAFSNSGTFHTAQGVNTQIQFCLAQQDPEGNATTGITRNVSGLTEMVMETDDIPLKDLIRWDPTKYINIWVIKEINSSSVGSGVAGYAYFPSSHGNPEDGIVIEAKWTGTSADDSKILVHELGHYLGCYHTFEGGCKNDNCLTDGDLVCDTPPDASTDYVNCNSSANTCSTDPMDGSSNNPFRPLAMGGIGDVNDMTSNYMDYNDIACQNLFTVGQKDRMVPSVELIRSSLLISPGCKSPCTSPIDLQISVSTNTINIGQPLPFSNTEEAGTNYSWDFGDGTFSALTNPVKTYNSTGTFMVKCIATNADINCKMEDTLMITVRCNVISTFTASSITVPLNGSVTFTNTSTGGATSWKWFVNGIQQSTATNFIYSFPAKGSHFIQLVSCGNLCCDTSEVTIVQAGICRTSHAGDVWCFGAYAAVSFKNGTPVALPVIPMYQSEGVASISNSQGNLLFYTNGSSVWNRTNGIMPNGSGLDGSNLAAQSSIIVPFHGDTNQFYIFTVHNWEEVASQLRYSVVDMRLNGGLGDIVAATKNTILQSNIAERVTAAYHKNCRDIWVISHEKRNNKFVSYLITAAGVSTTPVISHIGSSNDGGNRYGYLRLSHDGRKLCSTLGGSATLPTVELFDFSNETGKVNNPVVLAPGITTSNTTFINIDAYCSEFSPDNRILYTTDYNGAHIYQYDLYAGTDAQIVSSRQNIAVGSAVKPTLQMGPDNRIYACTYGSLGAINNPNAIGPLSNYVTNAVTFTGGSNGRLGLPNFFPGLFGTDVSIAGPSQVCQGAEVTFEATSARCLGDVEWKYIGSGSILEIDSNKIKINVGLDPGIQSVEAETPTECGTATARLDININAGLPPVIDLGKDSSFCGTVSYVLDAGPGFASYKWQNGYTGQIFTASAPGEYCVTVTNASGCIGKDCIILESLPPISDKNLVEDRNICPGDLALLDAGAGFTSVIWNTGQITQTIGVTNPGKYWYEKTVTGGCIIRDTINILSPVLSSLALGPDIEKCDGLVNVLDAGAGFKKYRWQDGSNQRYFTAFSYGKYWVTVTDTCGERSDTILINNNCPLGNEILSFTASLVESYVDFHYTLKEISPDTKVLIQRSDDGKNFSSMIDGIFIIDFERSLYTGSGREPAQNGMTYYRLVLIGPDGNVEYSKIVPVSNVEGDAAIVFPNPSEDKFTINFSLAQTMHRKLSLFTLDGKLLWKQEVDGKILEYSFGNDLANGVYILAIMENNMIRQVKLTKTGR